MKKPKNGNQMTEMIEELNSEAIIEETEQETRLDKLDAFGNPIETLEIKDQEELDSEMKEILKQQRIAEFGYDPEDDWDPKNPFGAAYAHNEAVIEITKEVAESKPRSKEGRELLEKLKESSAVQEYKRQQQLKEEQQQEQQKQEYLPEDVDYSRSNQTTFSVEPTRNVEVVSEQPEQPVKSRKQIVNDYYADILARLNYGLKMNIIPDSHTTYLNNSVKRFFENALKELNKPPKKTWLDNL